MELTKLIEQWCGDDQDSARGFIELFNYDKKQAKSWTRFVEFLASRPTCGKEQRKFLDEVENKAEVDHCYYEPGDPHPGFFLIFDDCDFGKIDLQKVIKGG